MLPSSVIDRLFNVGETFGLVFQQDNQAVEYDFKVVGVDGPSNLFDFSLGSATALNSAGTGWQNIQDSSNRWLLQPPSQSVIYQGFYGVMPSYIHLFRAYPQNVIRGSLVTVPALTGQFGFLTGKDTAYDAPSPLAEFFSMYALSPSFNAFHPLANPATVTTYMNFYIMSYLVDVVGAGKPGLGVGVKRAVVVGGVPPVPAPQWVRDAYGQRQAPPTGQKPPPGESAARLVTGRY